jgi:periplasmic protein TonB
VIARLGGMTLSILLHVGLVALLLAWSAADWTRPLFVDVVEHGEAPGTPGTAPSPMPSSRPAGRGAGSDAPPARTSARPEPVAPAASRTPASAPAASPEAPATSSPPPAMAIAPEPPAEPAGPPAPDPPAPPAPLASSTPSAQVDEGGAVSHGGSAVAARSGGQTRGDGDRGAGGGPGSPIALATPGAGGSGSPPAEYGPYLRHFRQRVQESLIYPLAARRQGLGGTVELHVWLESTGRVRDVQITRSSSHGLLDDAAVETIRRLGSVPFPESLPRRPLLIRIPLVYELR